jgi:glutamate dehydrogenase (NAD(P)+)
MVNIFESGDAFGPYKTIHVQNPAIGLKGILVIDNVAIGPSIGGLRIATDVSYSECARLARAMTWKNAAANLPHGGGKSVIFGDPRMSLEQKETLVRGMARALVDEQQYIFGPDMGTNEQCMAWVKDEIGRSVGLPAELGGIPLDTLGATGWGLAAAAEVAQAHCDFVLDGASLAVQGFGSVGIHAARFLAARGVKLVAVGDSRGAIHNPDGLDIESLVALKESGNSVIESTEGNVISQEELISIATDIWIPAARPDVINSSNVDSVSTKLILQGANIAVTADAEERLHKVGILCIPDFIANAGGVICAAMEYAGAGRKAAFDAIWEKIGSNTEILLETVKNDNVLPRAAGLKLAQTRVEAAMTNRRHSLY